MAARCIRDAGLGALYFFASHMVIRVFFYAGVVREPAQVLAFVLVALGAVCAVHLFHRAFLALRVTASAYLDAPVVSVAAALGALLVLLSIVPTVGAPALYAGGALVGASCGWLIVIWMSSYRVARPDERTFTVPPALLWAVGFYFLFRVAGTVSPLVSEGLLLALPLVTVGCMVVERDRLDGLDGRAEGGAAPEARAVEVRAPEDQAEEGRSLLVLVTVSALLAIGCAVVVHLAGGDDTVLHSGLSYQVLFEALAVALILAVCRVLRHVCRQRALPAHVGAFAAVLLVLPTFALGVATGLAFDPDSMASFTWETSLWVLLVAVFAYDMRVTPYIVDGLGVGLMFEAMCVGQLAAQVVSGGFGLAAGCVAGAVSVAYLAGVFAQLLAPAPERAGARGAHAEAGRGAGPAAGPVADPARAYERIAREYSLTPSEVRILDLVCRGWTARAISEELVVSFNTVRTHIKHIYEKLGIHSRQELLELVDGRR